MTTQTLLLLAVPFVLYIAGSVHVIRKYDTWGAWGILATLSFCMVPCFLAWIYMLGLLK
jgi:hypothetical protein